VVSPNPGGARTAVTGIKLKTTARWRADDLLTDEQTGANGDRYYPAVDLIRALGHSRPPWASGRRRSTT
jgi:hypothetical protein